MRKEFIFAIIAGVLIGLLVAFGAWKTAKVLKPKPTSIATRETPPSRRISNLSINNYKDFDVVNSNPKIIGQAEPNSSLIISTNNSDYLVKSNEKGEFETEIDIPAGLSNIKIYDLDSNESINLVLVFSTEVEENLTSYVGTITDISSGTIQVKVQNGRIAQISLGDETKIINTLKKNIEVKEIDLAIGDYIVGIGKVNQSKVLQAKRILVTSPIASTKFEIKKIKIESKTKTSINDISLPKTWDGPNLKELEVGQDIYLVGTVADDKTYTLRSIFKVVE